MASGLQYDGIVLAEWVDRDLRRHIHIYATQLIDELLKRIEVDDGIVINRDAQQ